MSPLDELFLVLLALYLFESIWCVPAAATLFIARLGGGLRRARVAFVEGGELSFVRAPLVLPFVPQSVVVPWTFALSPDGIVAYDGALKGRALPCARAARMVAFTPDPGFVADGKVVRAGTQSIARLDSARAAKDVARRLREIAALALEARGDAIDLWIAARLHVGNARGRLEALLLATWPLRAVVGALFVGLALVAPCIAYRFGLAVGGPWLLGGLVVGLASVVFTWTRAARRMREPPPDGGVGPAVAMAVYPAGAVRALDLLARGCFDDFDPVTLALAAGDARTRDEAVATALRETMWPLVFDDRPAAVSAAEAWFRGAWERELLRELLDCGVAPAALVAEPAPRDARDLSFCPRCRAHYAIPRATCADCEGVALVLFERNVDEE